LNLKHLAPANDYLAPAHNHNQYDYEPKPEPHRHPHKVQALRQPRNPRKVF